jgi:predicted nucleotidyltransferase
MIERPLEDALRRALSLLWQSGLRGAFGGGLAVIVWGQPRVTQDLDLVLEVERGGISELLRCAREEGFILEADDGVSSNDLLEGGFLRLLPPADAAPVSLDLLRADTPLAKEAIGRARSFEIAGLQVPVVSAEDLILLKLVAFRPKDTFDIETVIDATRDALDLDYLRSWATKLNLLRRLEAFLTRP